MICRNVWYIANTSPCNWVFSHWDGPPRKNTVLVVSASFQTWVKARRMSDAISLINMVHKVRRTGWMENRLLHRPLFLLLYSVNRAMMVSYYYNYSSSLTCMMFIVTIPEHNFNCWVVTSYNRFIFQQIWTTVTHYGIPLMGASDQKTLLCVVPEKAVTNNRFHLIDQSTSVCK